MNTVYLLNIIEIMVKLISRAEEKIEELRRERDEMRGELAERRNELDALKVNSPVLKKPKLEVQPSFFDNILS